MWEALLFGSSNCVSGFGCLVSSLVFVLVSTRKTASIKKFILTAPGEAIADYNMYIYIYILLYYIILHYLILKYIIYMPTDGPCAYLLVVWKQKHTYVNYI